MKFKVNDKIKVIRVYEDENRDCIGATGIITYIDPDWIYPYEVEFDDGKEYSKDLFLEKEIALFDENTEYKEDFINIKIIDDDLDGATTGDIIDILLANLKLRHNNGGNGGNGGVNYYFNITNAIARLTEAKMWVDELDKLDKK